MPRAWALHALPYVWPSQPQTGTTDVGQGAGMFVQIPLAFSSHTPSARLQN